MHCAAAKHVESFDVQSKHFTDYYLTIGDFPLLTSDYALYRFDYKADYDMIFAEFGWNHSRPLNLTLSRGAASL